MLQEAPSLTKAPSISENNTFIQTTLYDLIEAVNETVKPNDDRFVTEIVVDLLNVGHAKFQNAYHWKIKQRGSIMKAGIFYTESGPILAQTTHHFFAHPKLVEKFAEKGITKFIAYEVPIERIDRHE